MRRILIENVTWVNEGARLRGSVGICGGQIAEILREGESPSATYDQRIDATGCLLLPGVIDDHVHFRDPGLTQKADIRSESRAAAAGGVTSVMDMPNTVPQTTTPEAWEEKMRRMAAECRVNYSCYFGATNDNYTDFPQLDARRVCGIKLFMGSSTGNMLVDRQESLTRIFSGTDLLIAAHYESQEMIRQNTEKYLAEAGRDNDLPLEYHPLIRSEEACYASSALAVRLAQQTGARLHLLHVSTARELELLEAKPLVGKRITAEACIPHPLYTEEDYARYGTRIKCNPAIKKAADREALRAAVRSGRIDVIATDHAPHLLAEKQGGALKAVSGMPMVQFSLVSMLELTREKVFTVEEVVEKMCHAPARLYGIDKRGFLRTGYQADLVLVCPDAGWTVGPRDILSKCGWSPLEGQTLHWRVEKTFVNGQLVYTDAQVEDAVRGQELCFY